MRPAHLAALSLALACTVACDGGGRPRGWRATPPGEGPVVDWDLEALPLPEIPLPNDFATWPDPGSPTGRRLNPSFVAGTLFESRLRQDFGALDGWGTYAPITVSFDAPIDTGDVIARQGGDRLTAADFTRHAFYVVDLETGIPVPIDVQGGSFHYALERTGRYYPNDPRAAEANLLFESVEEDLDLDGVLDPGEDTDWDGVLDHPNTIAGDEGATPEETYDRMLWFWERETSTLVMRPFVPLEERRTYAVVLTDRLRDELGNPVRSPFPEVHAISQTRPLERLPEIFSAHPEIYGDLAFRGWNGVAFAWTFTTQSVTRDLDEAREGLYGTGRLSFLAREFPPDLLVSPVRGGDCAPGEPGPRIYTATMDEMRQTLDSVAGEAFGLSAEERAHLLDTFDQVSHFVLAFYESPYLLGDPDDPSPRSRWDVDRAARDRTVGRDLIPVIMVIPRATAARSQPFPVAFYGHGYTSVNLEALGFAGLMARNGIATVAIDAEGHGLGLDEGTRRLLAALFAVDCLAPMGQAIGIDRAIDLDGDAIPDSGGNFWSAYVFHTRDVVRQTVLDHVQLLRILRHFGADAPGGPRLSATGEIVAAGRALAATGDFDGDGDVDPAGDFDADGTIDVGGWNGDYHAWGQSLGGFVAPIFAGVDPAIRTAAPTSGAGGLMDVGIRSQIAQVQHAAILRALGPLVIGEPAPSDGPNARTACTPEQRRITIVVPSVADRADVEIACLPPTEVVEGDAVVVRNLASGEARCGAALADGRFRVGVPADTDDPLQIEIYSGAALAMDYATCDARDGASLPVPLEIDEVRVGNGTGPNECPETCARYQDRTWSVGDPLVSPTEGFGLRRQSPELRRFFQLAQTALEPGDPINYVRRIFLRPVAAEDWAGGGHRSLLVASSVGDQDVPLSAGNAMARAAGILPFLPVGAPAALADWTTPDTFAITYDDASPQALLNRFHVLEGVARLERHPIPENARFLADVDDLGEGLQLFGADGSIGGTLAPVRLDPPFRWTRASRPYAEAGDPFDLPPGLADAYSAVLNVYVEPLGNHGTEIPNAMKTWDEGVYFAHLVGRWFATRGEDLRYHTDQTGHHCLEDYTCAFFERP
jgi:hypothetical protein